MLYFVFYLILLALVAKTSARSEPDKNCVPHCLEEFEKSLAQENVSVSLINVASFTGAKLRNVCNIYDWDSQCLDTCGPSELQDAARLTMKPIAQLCTTHYDTVLNHTRCFEAAAIELGVCNTRCGSIEDPATQNRELATVLENNDQQEAFDIMDDICIQKLCRLDCEAQILATNPECRNMNGFNQSHEQIDAFARQLAAENIGEMMANWPILDDNNEQFPESCRRLQKESPTNNETKLPKAAHICSISTALLSILIAFYVLIV